MLMNIRMILVILIVLSLYMIICYYVGKKAKNIFIDKKLRFRPILYWSIYWSIALSYIVSALLKEALTIDNKLVSFVNMIGAISLTLLIYLVLTFSITDIIKFLLRKVNINGKIIIHVKRIYCSGISIFLMVFVLVAFGAWNAQRQVITNYDVNINKNVTKNTSLNIVMISDIHIGIGIKEKGIDKLVNSINELNPDIVFFCGDIVDESTTKALKIYYGKAFKNITSKYGVYAITGNHEYIGDLDETIHYLEEANIKVLQDEAVKIDNSFYVIGKNDPASVNRMKNNLKTINELVKDVDTSYPIILLNHRPIGIEEAKDAKVDLQLSGHTHKGQFFPGDVFTHMIFEDDYGYLKKDDFNLIVSSGYGTWGPPIRIGTKGEIVNIKVNINGTN